MNKIVTTALILLAAVWMAQAPASAQTTDAARILIVDFTRVTNDSLVGRDVAAQLERERVKIESRATELNTQLKTEQDELKVQRNIIAPDAFEGRMRDFNQRAQGAQDELTQMQQTLQRAAQQANLEIARQLKPIVIAVMQEKGGTMVLDKNIVYHSVAGLDVTTEVIDRLDAQMPSFQVSLPTPTASN